MTTLPSRVGAVAGNVEGQRRSKAGGGAAALRGRQEVGLEAAEDGRAA